MTADAPNTPRSPTGGSDGQPPRHPPEGLTYEHVSDEDLFAAFCATGCRGSFAALVDRHYGALRGFVYRRCGHLQQAEELTQETLLRVFTRAATFETGRRFKPWLYAIALNTTRAHFRDNNHDSPRDDTDPPGLAALGDQLCGDTNNWPETYAHKREVAGLVRQAVESLSAPQREVVLLSVYQGLSYPEIALATGKPLGTIKSLMFHALRALRPKLRNLDPDSPIANTPSATSSPAESSRDQPFPPPVMP